LTNPESGPINYRFDWQQTHWQDWVILLLSLWFFISPWVLNFGGGVRSGISTATTLSAMRAGWNAWIVGAIVLLVSLRELRREGSTPRLIIVLLGTWIFVAPWILHFLDLRLADWDHWIIGVLLANLAFWHLASATTR
jgi:hypothetical protein